MQHLDEGTVHAWLDGALTADEAARVERHAAECAECAAVMAEARGLVAGASRILSALDDVPRVAGSGERVARAFTGTDSASSGSPGRSLPATRYPLPAARRPLWSRPAALAAAASVVLMVGTAVVWREGVRPSSRGEAADGNSLARQMTEAVGDTSAGSATTPGVVPGISASGVSAPGETVSANTRGVEDASGADAAVGARPATGRAGTATAAEPRPLATRPPPAAPRRAAGAEGRDVTTRLEPVTGAAPVPTVPPAPARGVPAEQRTRRMFTRADSIQLSEVVVTGVGDDSTPARRQAAAQRAVARRAGAAQSEQAVPMAGRQVPAPAMRDTAYQVRSDTAYRMRTDTVTVSRVDTVTVATPQAPALRGAGRTASATRPFTVTGCYEVVEGRLPRFITLTVTPVWSGAAEQAFLATAPGAKGYWSQPRSGNVHLVIARVVVTARIDRSTGELRGKAHRGGKSERFVAKRGCG